METKRKKLMRIFSESTKIALSLVLAYFILEILLWAKEAISVGISSYQEKIKSQKQKFAESEVDGESNESPEGA